MRSLRHVDGRGRQGERGDGRMPGMLDERARRGRRGDRRGMRGAGDGEERGCGEGSDQGNSATGHAVRSVEVRSLIHLGRQYAFDGMDGVDVATAGRRAALAPRRALAVVPRRRSRAACPRALPRRRTRCSERRIRGSVTWTPARSTRPRAWRPARAPAARCGTPSTADVRPFSARFSSSQRTSTWAARVRRRVAEHVRVARDELVDDAAGDVVDVPRGVVLLGAIRAWNTTWSRRSPSSSRNAASSPDLDRLDGLVRLLEEVGHQRRVRSARRPTGSRPATAAGP